MIRCSLVDIPLMYQLPYDKQFTTYVDNDISVLKVTLFLKSLKSKIIETSSINAA